MVKTGMTMQETSPQISGMLLSFGRHSVALWLLVNLKRQTFLTAGNCMQARAK